MSFELIKDDLRIRRTKKSIIDAMTSLLDRQNFKKITITDICEAALVSRATFYSHFIDKYDLLRYWLVSLLPCHMEQTVPYEVLEKTVNHFVDQNKRIIKNMIEAADSETMHIVTDVITLFLGLDPEQSSKDAAERYIVYSNVFAGGIMYYLLWHVENKFPSEVMNIHLYDLIQNLCTWEPESIS